MIRMGAPAYESVGAPSDGGDPRRYEMRVTPVMLAWLIVASVAALAEIHSTMQF